MAGVKRPICPGCGEPALLTDDRFGGKYECPDCDMWAWGGKPLRTRQENLQARKDFKLGRRRVVNVEWDDTPEWAKVLGVAHPATLDQIDKAFRRVAWNAHPDYGGSVDAMMRIVAARDAAYAEIKGLFADTIEEKAWEL